MDEQMKADVQEISGMIGDAWKAIAITAGIKAEIYDELSMENPVSIEA